LQLNFSNVEILKEKGKFIDLKNAVKNAFEEEKVDDILHQSEKIDLSGFDILDNTEEERLLFFNRTLVFAQFGYDAANYTNLY